jgi:membrane-associated phospholipid phosphatase
MTGALVALAIAAVPEPSADWRPKPNFVDMLKDSGKVATSPFNLKVDELWILAPIAAVTAVAFHYDVRIHRQVRYQWPDPQLAGQRLSHWGSYLGEGWVNASLFAGVALAGGRKGQSVAIEGLEALAATALLSRALKLVFRFERPSSDPNHVGVFSGRWRRADAFPSGHSMAAFASATVLSSEYPIIGPFAYAAATYVGIARIQQSTHWASDVIVGAVLGIAVGRGALLVNHDLHLSPMLTRSGKGLMMEGTF